MSATATRVRIKTPSSEVRAERQHREDERSYWASATSVQYQADTDAITLKMQSGITVTIPLRLVDEISDAPASTLVSELTLGIGGDALSVPTLDVDIAVSGLLRDLLGFNIQRMGGRAKSEAKAAAARKNGERGGRPRKEHAA
jgi:hypothetical protein